jgi:hypothetical protein
MVLIAAIALAAAFVPLGFLCRVTDYFAGRYI